MNRRQPRARDSRPTLRRRTFISTVGVLGVGSLAGCLGTTESDKAEASASTAALLAGATLYKSPNCTCCLEYTDYLETNADVSIEVEEVSDLAVVKDEYRVPRDVESCHTVDLGDYYIEGHVPLAAINKLTEETPDIAGVALPNMPHGSPGMSGEKHEEFVLYAVHEDGSFDEFMRI